MNKIEFFMKKFIFSKNPFYNHDVMKVKSEIIYIFSLTMMTPTTIRKIEPI